MNDFDVPWVNQLKCKFPRVAKKKAVKKSLSKKQTEDEDEEEEEVEEEEVDEEDEDEKESDDLSSLRQSISCHIPSKCKLSGTWTAAAR